ncbi:hypothetical protein OG992_18750 [Micromonospora sp. NBC_00362]|uniref:hypothetical protein n=1 Tax=Micromonospora sp. NBC_00362 TaxID=2975975 RepID=UPI002257B2E1|nr:hypothetical protein [Micromonospora sp. NBC_00362]MCX5119229.1 hypothetical protein [Micromonospora sp. NBC_00362]
MMTGAQYELLNAALASPGTVVVDRRGVAWNLGAKCTRTFDAAQRRGYARLADEPDAAGQRAVEVTEEGWAAMRDWATKHLRTVPVAAQR